MGMYMCMYHADIMPGLGIDNNDIERISFKPEVKRYYRYHILSIKI
jgi:hypothetical protein